MFRDIDRQIFVSHNFGGSPRQRGKPLWGFKLFIKKNIITTTKNTNELSLFGRHILLLLTTGCYVYIRLDNVLALQNITEHYPPKTEHRLYINDLTQNIRLVLGLTCDLPLAQRHRNNWLHKMLVRGLTSVVGELDGELIVLLCWAVLDWLNATEGTGFD